MLLKQANTNIPYTVTGTGPKLIFSHANGYPASAYKELIGELSKTNTVYAMNARPLWGEQMPEDLHNWLQLADDLKLFIENTTSTREPWIGVGHSLGGTISLMAALDHPSMFRALILIDPPFFLPGFSFLWELIYRLDLGHRVHPLVQMTMRRRRIFQSMDDMFDNYRNKRVFRYLSNEALRNYVISISHYRNDKTVELAYSPEWEARIYLTSSRMDRFVWRQLNNIRCPVLVIRGEEYPTFSNKALEKLHRLIPQCESIDIPQGTHLVPLEKPALVAGLIANFVRENPYQA